MGCPVSIIARWAVATAVAAWSAAGASPPVLTVHYQERPPYSNLEADGRVTGLVATPAARALERAGITFEWQRTPAQRQLALIQQGERAHCGLGWFRTPQREALGQFSVALYRDRPLVALMRVGAVPASGSSRAADLLAAPGLRVVLKEGFSYGLHLDALIAGSAAALRSPAELDAIARLVAAGRADWMIASAEEVPALQAAAAGTGGALREVRLTDVPEGPTRHLYCNAAVPAAWLSRIDRALAPTP